MNLIRRAALLAVCLLMVASAGLAATPKNPSRLAEQVQAAIEGFKKADSTMAERFATSAGYVLFPAVGKGGLVLGGARGTGEVYHQGQLIGYASLTQVTLGLQIGGQEFSEVIFFENDAALERFKENKLEMSAQVGAVAAAEGASKNARYEDGVIIFTRPRTGLMAEASVGGQKFRFTPLASGTP